MKEISPKYAKYGRSVDKIVVKRLDVRELQ